MDAWFAGYQPKLVGIAWIGYDQPKSLGDRETGGGLALPIWINYMAKALKDQPMVTRTMPEGLIEANGDYYYKEYPPGGSVRDLGMGNSTLTPDEEKKRTEVKNELF